MRKTAVLFHFFFFRLQRFVDAIGPDRCAPLISRPAPPAAPPQGRKRMTDKKNMMDSCCMTTRAAHTHAQASREDSPYITTRF